MKLTTILLGTLLLSASAFANSNEVNSKEKVLNGKTDVVFYYSSQDRSWNVGFSDPTVRTPTLSNPGETLGEARRYVAEYAAKIIESQFYSEAGIYFKLSYDYIYSAALSTSYGYLHTEWSNDVY